VRRGSETGGIQGVPAAREVSSGWIEGYFQSWDQAKIFFRFYPVAGARHTVVILHGYGEHSGRYEKFPEKMRGLAAQFAVMDLRGMGKSDGTRGDIGSFEDYLRDLSEFVAHLREKHSISSKFILFGHSLGGLLALDWAMKNPAPVKLLILSAPFLGFRFSRLVISVNRLLRLFAPQFIYKNLIRSRTLSHDPVEIAIHRKDPLILRQMSSRLISEIAESMSRIARQPVLSVPFSIHLMIPGKELVVDPEASRRFFERVVCPRKERTIFEGFFHEPFHEQDQQRAFNVLKTIIEDCV